MDEKRLTRIEDKIDKVLDHQASTDVTLGKQHVQLTEHIRRTELLEADVKPIKRHVAMIDGAIKLIALLGVIYELYKALK